MTYTWRHQKRRYHVPPPRKRYNNIEYSV